MQSAMEAEMLMLVFPPSSPLDLSSRAPSVFFTFSIHFQLAFVLLDDSSRAFEEFLALLGKRVELKGWDRYRGGLDIKGYSSLPTLSITASNLSYFSANMTGSESVYTVYEGHEVMFHVSTLLPQSADKQQVERKRHIGNDIVNIVFVDDPAQVLTFDPSLIKSQFTRMPLFSLIRRIIFLIIYRCVCCCHKAAGPILSAGDFLGDDGAPVWTYFTRASGFCRCSGVSRISTS